MPSRGIFVATTIRASLEDVWHATQDPAQHVRWDVRFSRITPTTPLPGGGARFVYERRVAFHTVHGHGVSIGETARPDGSRTSALRFDTADRLSPIRAGRGYWRYVTVDGGVHFVTGYDYTPGRGFLDPVVRPLLGWATAWSFDRLRLWLETGTVPERWPLWSVLWVWRRDRPRAGRCRRRPDDRTGAMDDAPATLAALPAPGAGR